MRDVTGHLDAFKREFFEAKRRAPHHLRQGADEGRRRRGRRAHAAAQRIVGGAVSRPSLEREVATGQVCVDADRWS